MCYSLNENKASFLHNLHFWCCAGQVVAPRNIVRTAADGVLSEDYSCVSRDAVFFVLFFVSLFLSTNLSSCMGEGSCSKSKKLLPHSKPHLAHQHQTREEGIADLNVVISTFRKN